MDANNLTFVSIVARYPRWSTLLTILLLLLLLLPNT
jgi:hypothetical protein